MATLPTRIFAGVQVPDTHLISEALALCRKHLDDFGYNHCVRSWLFGFAIAAKIPDLQGRDLEAHAVAAILHDLGWAFNSDLVSEDMRFEVDGANAARDFLKREASDWDKHRIQLVWDAIALHTIPTIANYKEPEVIATHLGILADFVGPDLVEGGHLTWEAWNIVVKEFPRLGMKEGVREIFCKLCRTKPETTYNNIAGQYGQRYVEGYTVAGNQIIDLVEGMTVD